MIFSKLSNKTKLQVTTVSVYKITSEVKFLHMMTINKLREWKMTSYNYSSRFSIDLSDTYICIWRHIQRVSKIDTLSVNWHKLSHNTTRMLNCNIFTCWWSCFIQFVRIIPNIGIFILILFSFIGSLYLLIPQFLTFMDSG